MITHDQIVQAAVPIVAEQGRNNAAIYGHWSEDAARRRGDASSAIRTVATGRHRLDPQLITLRRANRRSNDRSCRPGGQRHSAH